jgi:hypothetical protein
MNLENLASVKEWKKWAEIEKSARDSHDADREHDASIKARNAAMSAYMNRARIIKKIDSRNLVFLTLSANRLEAYLANKTFDDRFDYVSEYINTVSGFDMGASEVYSITTALDAYAANEKSKQECIEELSKDI